MKFSVNVSPRRSGIDLPLREYEDDYNPSKRLAYKEELERSWWKQWKVQCFDSLLSTNTWNVEKRGVKVGDVVLISYTPTLRFCMCFLAEKTIQMPYSVKSK